MNRDIKVGLLSLIIMVQALTLIGGHIAYQQMSQTYGRLQWDYMELFEEAHGLHIDFGLDPNPFAPLIPLVLLGLFLTLALFADEIRHC